MHRNASCLLQVRQVLTEYAVLPLGSQRVHERLEPCTKALLLYGPHDTGKKLLANAIANCTGVLQTLSPASFFFSGLCDSIHVHPLAENVQSLVHTAQVLFIPLTCSVSSLIIDINLLRQPL